MTIAFVYQSIHDCMLVRRSQASPVLRLYSFLWPKQDVNVDIYLDGEWKEHVMWEEGSQSLQLIEDQTDGECKRNCVCKMVYNDDIGLDTLDRFSLDVCINKSGIYAFVRLDNMLIWS